MCIRDSYKHNDVIIIFLLQAVYILLYGLVLYIVQKKGLSELGITQGMPVSVIIVVSMNLILPFVTIYRPLFNTIARTTEKNADCFAAQLGLPIAEALTSITKVMHQTFNPSPLYSFVYYNHPPLDERVEHISKCKK